MSRAEFPLIFDAHLDLAWNALDWNRDLLLPVHDIRQRETALGMTGKAPLEIDLAKLPNAAVVDDIVYIPLETDLLARARARGNTCVDGLGMLLHQGRMGFKAWFGKDVQVSAEQRRAVASDLGA